MSATLKKLVPVCLLVLALLAACSSPTTPEPTATATATAIPVEPTATDLPPTSTPEPAPTATPVPVEEVSEEVVLTLTAGEESLALTMTDLQALPAYEGWGGIKNSTGRITPPAWYKGVQVSDLVDQMGGLDKAAGISIVAADGYAMTLAYNQIYDGNFVAYDPGTGDEIDPGCELVSVIAYAVDDAPLPADSEGTLRLVVLGDLKMQVTDGHWWVKWANAIEVRDAGAEWFLSLDGAISEEMDRATFESCSSPSCHGTAWTDDEGYEWIGTPLYLIAARIDDENKHDFGGFNVELAEAGYTITLTAADGYAVDIASGDAMRNENMIIAINKDSDVLPEEFFPLRLVGADVARNQMVGQIAAVKVLLGPTAIITPPDQAALLLNGLVENDLSLSMESLQAMGLVQRSLEHPKQGMQDYEGVPLNVLLAAAGPRWEADTLRLVAGDGYSVDVDLLSIKTCADCMVALDGESGLMSVMPGMESKAWVKDLAEIQIVQAGAEDEGEAGEASEGAAEPAAELPQAAAGEAALSITGLVAAEQYLSMETLQGMNVVQISAEHPKDGTMTDYEGVRLSDLLNYAAPTAEASSLVITASDGYQTSLSLAEALACADCLVGFNNEGTLKMVMPGLESNFWVKDVVSIELQ